MLSIVTGLVPSKSNPATVSEILIWIHESWTKQFNKKQLFYYHLYNSFIPIPIASNCWSKKVHFAKDLSVKKKSPFSPDTPENLCSYYALENYFGIPNLIWCDSPHSLWRPTRNFIESNSPFTIISQKRNTDTPETCCEHPENLLRASVEISRQNSTF